jgi:hypothetical protein
MARKVFIHYLTTLSVRKTAAQLSQTVNSELEIISKQAIVVQSKALSQLLLFGLKKTSKCFGVATVLAQN